MPDITNVVVLMLENRSYDNVLGGLYLDSVAPEQQQCLEGLKGHESNPDPRNLGNPPIRVHATTTPVTLGGSGPAYPPTCLPLQDPGEPFNDMAQQFLSLPEPPVTNPYPSYDPASTNLMKGFAANYYRQLRTPEQQQDNVADIMNYLTPEQLPVTAFLARYFGVCDQWFASAPTHTFTNRTFALLAAPAVERSLLDGRTYSYMDDPQWAAGLIGRRVPSTSIFEQLDNVYPSGKGSKSAPNWRVYFHDYPIACLVDDYVAGIARSESNENVASFDGLDWRDKPPLFGSFPETTFLSDVKSGLPKFSFIEPRYNMQSSTFSATEGDLLPNCAHPGFANLPLPSLPSSKAVNAPSDAASAELLLLRVYNLLQQSPNWATTLFIVTYDEPGGTYDHVPPASAKRPGSKFPPAAGWLLDRAAEGFTWEVLGGRVPAIVVSPLIAAGSTIRDANAMFDHTSIIRTVWDTFNLATPAMSSLTERDAAAPSLLPSCIAANDTPPFSGTIVCAPSALVFLGTGTLMFYASAGSTPIAASFGQGEQPSWLTKFSSTPWNESTQQLEILIGVDAGGVSGIQQASFTITGEGLQAVSVSVTLSAG